ncbi:MAG: hypothetical protein ABIG60_04340 [Patescibacteria group bacterium]
MFFLFFKKLTFVFFLGILVIIVISFIFIANSPQSELAYAGSGDNVSGYAWSEKIGWISFNCEDTGLSCATTGDWGVDIDISTGILSGYAWSENLGWISFNRADTGVPPQAPFNGVETYIAKYYSDGSNQVRGWAKILSLGDGGWIKLRGTDADGVHIDGTGEFIGWAWNGNDDGTGIGWISFNSDTDGSAVEYHVQGDIIGQPQNVLVTQQEPSCSTLNVEWDIPVQGTVGFQVFRDGVQIVSSPGTCDAWPLTGGTCNDINLTSGQSYSYVVRACMDVGCTVSNDSAASIGTTNAVCQVTSLLSTGTECPNSIFLGWDAIAGATSYNVYRQDETNGDPSALIVSGNCSSPVTNGCTDTVPVGTESHRFKYQVSATTTGPPVEEGDLSTVSGEFVACPYTPDTYEEINPGE